MARIRGKAMAARLAHASLTVLASITLGCAFRVTETPDRADYSGKVYALQKGSEVELPACWDQHGPVWFLPESPHERGVFSVNDEFLRLIPES
jgi:hypothetical protein